MVCKNLYMDANYTYRTVVVGGLPLERGSGTTQHDMCWQQLGHIIETETMFFLRRVWILKFWNSPFRNPDAALKLRHPCVVAHKQPPHLPACVKSAIIRTVCSRVDVGVADFFFFFKLANVSHSTGWWFQTILFIFQNIWDNPCHWLIYFSEGLKPPTRYLSQSKTEDPTDLALFEALRRVDTLTTARWETLGLEWYWLRRAARPVCVASWCKFLDSSWFFMKL